MSGINLDEFDFGADLAESAGGLSFENPKVGTHAARLRDIIHLGCIGDSRYPDKEPSNRAVAVFELKEDEDKHSQTGDPLLFPYMFNLVKGDNSFLNSKLLPALLTQEDIKTGAVKSFDDMIGKGCQLELSGSKDTYKDEKTGEELPKYINLKGISSLHHKLAAITDDLVGGGLGHVRLKDFNKECIEPLNMFMHIQEGIMKSVEWKEGTHPAIPIIEEIRKERPNFAKPKAKDDKNGKPDAGNSQAQQPAATGSAAPEDLSEGEEF